MISSTYSTSLFHNIFIWESDSADIYFDERERCQPNQTHYFIHPCAKPSVIHGSSIYPINIIQARTAVIAIKPLTVIILNSPFFH
tara:strand:+ start:963 stop:1217 length:255 start_codon:yes stop_codon:yes gene_type:complete